MAKVLFFLHLSAEDEGEGFGRLEEHPRASSLGGLQAVPGPAAEQAERRVSPWRAGRS